MIADFGRHVSSTEAILIGEDGGAGRQIAFLLGALTVGKSFVLLTALIAYGGTDFLYNMSTKWDSGIFQSIAVNGYTQLSDYAFSPLYPFFIKGLDLLVSHAWVSSLIVTNIVGFLFALVVYRAFGYRTALLAALFPTYLVYSTIPYSDVIALFFLALSMLLVMKENIYESSAAIGLAILSSYRLACTLPAYAYAVLKTKRFKNLVFFLVPIIAGVAILLWFKSQTGDYLTYFSVEKDNWGAGLATPIEQAKWILNSWFTSQDHHAVGVPLPPAYWLARNILFEVFYLVGAIFLLRTSHKHKVFLFLYTLLAIVPLLCTTGIPAVSIPRLLLPAFPAFYGYSAMLKKAKHYWGYFAASLALTIWVLLSQVYSFFA